MGKGGQVRVNSMEEVKDIVVRDNGKHHLYISHNSFPGEWNSIRETDQVRIHQLFYDLDHNTDLNLPLQDLRKLVEWHEENDLDWIARFSAGKGFHLYTIMEPAIYSLTDKTSISVDKELSLADYYKAWQLKLKRILGLETLDLRCAEPRRICRISNTQHMKTGFYCIPLTYAEIMKLTIGQIKQLATEPQIDSYYPTKKSRYKFHEFIDEFNISVQDRKIQYTGIESFRFKEWRPGEGKKWEWFKKMMPPYDCVIQEMYDEENPAHMARFASAIWWKIMADNAPVVTLEGIPTKICPTPQWVNDFYVNRGYKDLCKEDEDNDPYPCGLCDHCRERHDNINCVFAHSYKMPTCMTLYDSDICVGPKCKKYSQFLDQNVDGSKVKKR
jgi:hypothetical protein